MAKKTVDIGAISVNSDTTVGTRRNSTGEIHSSSSTPSSTSKEKRLPIYLRTYSGSCHDACKHGAKHDTESKRPSLLKSGSRLTLSLREESLRQHNPSAEDRRKSFAGKPKSASLPKDIKPAASKLNPASKIRETGVAEKHVEVKFQSPSLTQSRSSSIVQQVLPTSSSKDSQVNVIDVGDEKATKLIKTKTLSKSHSQLSLKHSDGKMKNTSGDQGTASFQKSAIVRNNAQLLQEATTKPKLVNQASLKSHITHDKAPNFKHKSSVPDEATQVNAEHVASKSISKTSAVASGSSHTQREPKFHRKEESIANNKETTRKQEKKTLKPSAASSSLKHIGGDISSSKLRKHDHEKGASPMEDQKVKKIEQHTESNEDRALQVNNDIQEKVTLDSAEKKSLQVEKVLFDSAILPLTECRNSDVDSLQQTLLESENADMGLLEKKLPELENVSLDSLEQFPDDKKNLEPKDANTDLLDQKAMNPNESTDSFDSLSLKPDDLKLFEQGNDGINFLDNKQPKPLEADFESLEMESSSQNLIKPESADMDFPLSTLLKQEDTNHDSLEPKDIDQELLQQENASMNFIEEEIIEPEKDCHSTTETNSPSATDLDFQVQTTLLKQEDMDLTYLEQEHTIMNSLEKKMIESENDADSSNDTNLSSATDDDEEDIGDSESASSERAELEPEDELEVGKGDCELIKGGERIRKERRNTAVHPDNNTCTPHKLKFRRGRTIELEPESNGPRRLRFRRRRTVDASVNGVQLERKKFQRNEITQAADDTSLESQSVVLKHQDMQEKKDAQGLFNNVIEETASKLVETRKSKVKALVGAFETVISLQDSKPESTA